MHHAPQQQFTLCDVLHQRLLVLQEGEQVIDLRGVEALDQVQFGEPDKLSVLAARFAELEWNLGRFAVR